MSVLDFFNPENWHFRTPSEVEQAVAEVTGAASALNEEIESASVPLVDVDGNTVAGDKQWGLLEQWRAWYASFEPWAADNATSWSGAAFHKAEELAKECTGFAVEWAKFSGLAFSPVLSGFANQANKKPFLPGLGSLSGVIILLVVVFFILGGPKRR